MRKTQTQLTLSFDLSNNNMEKQISTKQFDNLTRHLCVKLIRNGTAFSAPEGAVVTLRGTKPNGSAFDIVGTEDAEEKGIYSFLLDDNALAVAGRIRCDVAYFKNSADSFLLGSTEVFAIENIRAAIDPYAEKDAEVFQSMESVSAAVTADAQAAIAEVNRVAEELLTAKANGEFKGEKGDKGDKGDAGYELTETDIVRIASEIPLDNTLSKSNAAADAAAVGTALAGKAPAGYGLGVAHSNVLTSESALDLCTVNGWYYYAGDYLTKAGVGFTNALVHVKGQDNYNIMQELFPAGSNTRLLRTASASAWGEWECDNPPMYLGVEYRTTERWNGLAVWTTLIDCGITAANDKISVLTDFSCNNVIRCSGDIAGMASPFIHGTLDGWYSTWATAHNQSGYILVEVYANGNGGNASAKIQVWYTK